MELKPNSAEIAFSGVWLSGSESKRTASYAPLISFGGLYGHQSVSHQQRLSELFTSVR